MSDKSLEETMVERLAPLVAEVLGMELIPPAPLSAVEFAELANMSKSNVYTMLREGALDTVPESPRLLIPHRELCRVREGRAKKSKN